MPFGLRNAPTTFQVMMKRCLLHLEAFSSPYMDDVIIFSQTWSDHLSHLFQVLSRLKLHGLTVKQSKYLRGCTKFEFLVYVVGEGSLSIPKSRIDKFQVKPAIKKQLCSFISLCGYYRKFVPAFADFSSCLNHALTNTSEKVVWNETMTKSFNIIISSICHHTLLTKPTCDDKFVLSCDASSYGVGSVLSVECCDLELPIAFYSHQLLSHETRYSATELEVLALSCSVKH